MRSPYLTVAPQDAPTREPGAGAGSALLGAALAALLVLSCSSSVMAQQNEPPVSDPNGPYQGFVRQSIWFDGSASFDRDGRIIAYDWEFGDGSAGSGPSPTHVYAAAAEYKVALRVTDDGDATHVAETLAIIKPSVVEVDRFDRSWAEIELISPSGGSERIHLTGPTVVHVFFGEK